MKDFKIRKSSVRVNLMKEILTYVNGIHCMIKLEMEQCKMQIKSRSGGSYDIGRGQIKIGTCVELDEGVQDSKLVIQDGKYDFCNFSKANCAIELAQVQGPNLIIIRLSKMEEIYKPNLIDNSVD